MAMTDAERYGRYVNWCYMIGAPTSLTFEEWAKQDSAEFTVRQSKQTLTAKEFFAQASAKAPTLDELDGNFGEDDPVDAPEGSDVFNRESQ